MKICIIHRYPPSLIVTSDMSFNIMVKELLQRGHQVTYLSYEDLSDRKPEYSYISMGIKFDRVKKMDRILKSALFLLLAPLAAAKLRHDFDLFYCHDSLPFYGYFCKLAGCRPVVIRLGDLMTDYFLSGKGAIATLVQKAVSRFEEHTWKNVDGIVSISPSFSEYILSKGTKKDTLLVAEESVDTIKFKPIKDYGETRAKLEIGNSDFVILYHGIIDRWKGLETLLQAAVMNKDRIPNLKLVIIGDGPLRETIEELNTTLGMGKYTKFLGWVPFDKMEYYLSVADLGIVMRSGMLANNFVLTTALLQLWACGIPVIAPNLRAIAAVAKENHNALLFTPGNEKMLAEKIYLAYADKGLRENIARRGRETVVSKFDHQTVGKEFAVTLEAVYNRLHMGS